jgi:hypothetical protein
VREVRTRLLGGGEADAPEIVAYPRVMCGWPVDAAATRAAHEMVLGGEDIGGYLPVHFFLADGYDWLIATRAPCEEVCERIELVGRNDLTELLAEVVAFDEQQRRRRMLAQQLAVTRENDPPLAARVPDQCSSCQVRPAGCVMADKAEPDGEAAEHTIDRKLEWSRSHATPRIGWRSREGQACADHCSWQSSGCGW